jgi:hypothetical protein
MYRDYFPWIQQDDYLEKMEESAVLNTFSRKRIQLSGMEDIFSVRDIEAAAVEAAKLALNFTNQMVNLPRELKDALLADTKEDIVSVKIKDPTTNETTTIQFDRQGGAKRRVLYVLDDVQRGIQETLSSFSSALGITVKIIPTHDHCANVSDSDIEQSCGFMMKYPPLGSLPDGSLPKPIQTLADRMRNKGAMLIYSIPSVETLQYQGYENWVPPPEATIVVGHNARGALAGRKMGFLGTSYAKLVEAFGYSPREGEQPQQQEQQQEAQQQQQQQQSAGVFSSTLSHNPAPASSLASTLASLSSGLSSAPGASSSNAASILRSSKGSAAPLSASATTAGTSSFSYTAKVKPEPLHVTMKQLMSAHAHIGLHAAKWNSKMDAYLLGQKDHVHIFDISKTQPLLRRALGFVSHVVKEGYATVTSYAVH